MTATQSGEVGEREFPTLTQQADIIRDALDAVSANPDTVFTQLSMGRYRFGQFALSMGYVFGEATMTLTRYGSTIPLDLYIGQNPIVWFLDGELTPTVLLDELHKRLDSHGF